MNRKQLGATVAKVWRLAVNQMARDTREEKER